MTGSSQSDGPVFYGVVPAESCWSSAGKESWREGPQLPASAAVLLAVRNGGISLRDWTREFAFVFGTSELAVAMVPAA